MDQEQMIRRICDLDIIVANLQEKLAQTLASFEDLRAKSVQKQEFEQNKANFQASLPQNSEFIQKTVSNLQRSIDSLNKSESTYKEQIDALFERTFIFSNRSENLTNAINACNERHETNERKLFRVEKQQEDCRKIIADYPPFQADIYRSIAEIKSQIEKNDQKIKICESNISSTMSRLEVWDRESRIAFEGLKSEFSKIKQSIEDNARSMDVGFSNINNKIDVKISNIPKVEIPPQVDVKAAVNQEFKELSSKLNDIKLDLENSSLKFSNNEMQTKMFEKKLENLSLLLKKYEITK